MLYVPFTPTGNARNHGLFETYPNTALVSAIGWTVLAVPAWLGTLWFSTATQLVLAAISIYFCTVLVCLARHTLALLANQSRRCGFMK